MTSNLASVAPSSDRLAGERCRSRKRTTGCHFYSVPYKYVGQKVKVMWDTELVEVYCGTEFVCSHSRSFTPYAYSIKKEHMPEAHKAYERSKEQNASTFLASILHRHIHSMGC